MFSKRTPRGLVVDRRDVLVTLAAATVPVLCPATVMAQGLDFDWPRDTDATAPQGQDAVLPLQGSSVDVGALAPGDVVVVSRPMPDEKYTNQNGQQHIAILHRTAAQIEAASRDTSEDPAADAGRVQDPAYLVVDLLCPHRNWSIGMTGFDDVPFACMKHNSKFDTSGRVLEGRAEQNLSIPDYTIDGTVITFT